MCTKPVTIPSLDLLKQMKVVLRFAPGDQAIIFDNQGKQYLVTIVSYESDGVSISIIEEQNNITHSSRETWLFASLIKKDNFEWIVEKATELGVSHIVPMISQRSEKKDLNMERLNKIAIEASEQSGRVTIPTIHPVQKLKESFEIIKDKKILPLAFHTEGQIFKKEEVKDAKSIAAFVGPEGGWTPEEITLFNENNIAIRNLGPQILRAETAVVAILSQLVF